MLPSLRILVADTAERDRRWQRRSFWTGCLLAIGIVLFMFGQSFYVRWKLERHGWEVGARGFGFTRLQAWRRQYLSRWIDPIEDLWLEDMPVLPRDLELMRYFPNLKHLDLKTTAIDEQAAISISQCPRLEKLRFWDVAMDDSCIPILAKCRSLRSLEFGEMAVNDESLIHLQKLDRLTELDLHETGSKGLQHITNCFNLEKLEISNGRFVDADLSSLAHLSKLRKLTLGDCPVTDDGARILADSCPSILELNLCGNRLTDAALAHLARLPNLEILILNDQPISNVGLRELKACAKLQRVNVRHSRVTRTGIEELKRAIPKIKVYP